jgi:hypothetical protein
VRKQFCRLSLLAVATLLLSAPALLAAAETPGRAGGPRNSSDIEQSRMAGEISGFGGLFYDEQGFPHVYLTDTGKAADLRALGPDVRIHKGDYDFRQLAEWKNALLDVLGRPDVVYLDVDERTNRVRIGLNREIKTKDVAGLEAAVAAAAVPAGAVVYSEVAPIHNLATLQDKVRPVPGGVQIAFGSFLCTKGFGANRAGVVGFVTNSHCSGTQGGVQSTVMYQNTNSAANRIGIETADPAYFTGSPCPAGRRCRYSDSAFARYDSSGLREFARIARTTAVGSLTVSTTSPRFTITGTANFPSAGQTLNKMGRTTGWSRGTVSSTCANINVSGTTITLLCQDLVTAAVNSGDSGSPVFSATTTGTTATLYGILWGGGGGSFAMSAWENIVSELGALTVF